MKSSPLPSHRPLSWSLPSRERGLKSRPSDLEEHFNKVAPFAGAWIEITNESPGKRGNNVAPFAGAWIEINTDDYFTDWYRSRSLRGSVD